MATYVVTTLSDVTDPADGELSLREAVALANLTSGLDTIEFAASLTGTLVLTSSITITEDLEVSGDSIGNDDIADITLSGGGANRIFEISGSTTVVQLNSLTLTNGDAGSGGSANGGAIFVDNASSLTLVHSTISDSEANGDGGGIYVRDTDLTIVSSTLFINRAGITGSGDGGAIYSRGGNVTLVNATIDGNTASGDGGGLWFREGTLTIDSSTITRNTNGGVFLDRNANATITNSVLALNYGTRSDLRVDDNSSTAEAFYSFFGDDVTGPGNFYAQTGTTENGGDPGLDALANNGGPVMTVAIQDGSALIGAGDATRLPTDPFDVDGDGNFGEGLPLDAAGQARIRGTLDIGAVEFRGIPTITSDGGGDTASINVAENQTAVTDVQTTDDSDAEGAGLTYTIGGTDSGLFTIDAGTGVLTFTNAPDFETPLDGDGDNDYEADVTVTDSSGETDTQSITVTVTDVIEPGTTFVVDTTVDEDDGDFSAGDLSLREAIGLANANATSPDIITFADGVGEAFEGGGTINLTLGELVLASTVDIDGDLDDDGMADVTLDAGGLSRIVRIMSADTTMTGLVLTGGSSATGAAISNYLGTVELRNSTVSGNSTTTGNGGGIYNGATMTVVNSTISGNSANQAGGGLLNRGTLTIANSTVSNNRSEYNSGGGLANDGNATVVGTTFVGNIAGASGTAGFPAGEGGGIANLDTLTLTNSTLTGNYSVFDGGGVSSVVAAPQFTLNNTIITGNMTGTLSLVDLKGLFVGANNLVFTAADTVFETTATVNGIAAGVLDNNGGYVQTVALKQTGVAIDAGNIGVLPGDTADVDADADTFEQIPLAANGVGRIQANTVDIGAYEAVLPTETPGLIVTTLSDVVDMYDQVTSLREAAAHAATLVGPQTITFDAGLSGGTIRMSGGMLTLSSDLTIQGDIDANGTADITLSGDINGDDATTTDGAGNTITDALNNTNESDNLGGITISSGNVRFEGLVVTGGYTTGTFSGVRVAQNADLEIVNSSISGNDDAGGILTAGDLILRNTTVFGNISTGGKGGAGLYMWEGRATIYGGTFAQNIATRGGAIETLNASFSPYGGGSALTIYGTVFQNNTATISGGAISARDVLIMDGATVTGNSSSTLGGGIRTTGSATITNSTISNNQTAYNINGHEGGGIINNGDLVISGSTISGNRSWYGGGIGGNASGLFVSYGNMFMDNIATQSGGGAITSSSATIVNSTFFRNTAGGDGGAISRASGGAKIYSSTFTGNNAPVTGGAITANVGTISNSIVTGNYAFSTPDIGIGNTLTGVNIIGGDIYDGSVDVGNVSITDIFDQTALVNGVLAGLPSANGGPVQTVALLDSVTNPAADAGLDSLLDEVSVSRDLNGDGDMVDVIGLDATESGRIVDLPLVPSTVISTVDLGAYELHLPGTPTSRDDTLTGTPNVDTLDGLGGNDSIIGLASDDILIGGSGNDTIEGGTGADSIDGGTGINDTVDYSNSSARVTVFLNGVAGIGGDAQGDTLTNVENLIGTNANDFLGGSAASNSLAGLDSQDILDGQDGGVADTLNGGDGIDTAYYFGAIGNQVLDMSDHTNLANNQGEHTNDVWISIEGFFGANGFTNDLTGDNVANYLLGGSLGDTISGLDGADHLYGRGGNDTLIGGNGNDVLLAGEGTDTVTGGADLDIFYILNGNETDIITDWSEADDFFFFYQVTGVSSYGDLMFTDLGADMRIWSTVNSTFEIIVQNRELTDLDDQTHFVFA